MAPHGLIVPRRLYITGAATPSAGALANYPFALAPGMGLNAYFTYVVVLGMGVPWQTALGAVFISGVIFILLTLARLRELVVTAIPAALKLATGAGTGSSSPSSGSGMQAWSSPARRPW